MELLPKRMQRALVLEEEHHTRITSKILVQDEDLGVSERWGILKRLPNIGIEVTNVLWSPGGGLPTYSHGQGI